MDTQQQTQQAQQALHFFAAMAPAFILIGLVFVAIYIIPLWRICTKAGLSGPLSLIALIPGVGKLITLYIIAFSDWRVVPTANLPGMMPNSYPPPPAYPPANYPPAAPPQL